MDSCSGSNSTLNLFDETTANSGLQPTQSAAFLPFKLSYHGVAYRAACKSAGFRCLRAADIRENSVIVQDIFSLVFRAQVVVVDFSGKNPNVRYETGIAHTLGKHVFPISQSIDDVPFDLQHHRVLKYLSNGEGLSKITAVQNR